MTSKDSLSYFRALNIHALVGHMGGYMGLILGFSISQTPSLFIQIFNRIFTIPSKRMITSSTESKRSLSSLETRIEPNFHSSPTASYHRSANGNCVKNTNLKKEAIVTNFIRNTIKNI